MKIDEKQRVVELTERNLRALLAKLEGHPHESFCTIERYSEQGLRWSIKAVPDEEHYSDREPGFVIKETREAMETDTYTARPGRFY